MLILFADDAETLEREAECEESDEDDPRRVDSENPVRMEVTAA